MKSIINLDSILRTIERRLFKLEKRISFKCLNNYADDTEALSAGLKSGDFYIITSTKLIKQIS